MNLEPRDDLDRAIDETLRSMVAGEPRRVTAATVRASLEPGRRASVPVWYAAAAALLVGALLSLRLTTREEPTRTTSIAPPKMSSSPAAQTAQVTGPTSAVTRSSSRPARLANALDAMEPSGPAYEGLPRLDIASLEPPSPLLTGRLEASGLVIPNLEITPLALSTLSIEPDNRQ